MATSNRTNSKNRKSAPVETLQALNGKLPPQAPELEEEVLGSIMIEPNVYNDINTLLRPDSFYFDRNRKIYQAIVALASKDEPLDALSVMQQLKRDNTFEEVGGLEAISALTSRVTTTAHVVYYSQIIAQKALARQLITLSNNIITNAYDEANDIADVMQNAEGEIFELSQRQHKRDVTQIDPVIAEAFRRIQIAGKNTDSISGIPSGFNDLDKITSGWQASDLIIIAARPAMGKTAFVLSMAKNMAVDYGKAVALFSLEMSNVQLVNRLIMNVCEIEGDKIRNGKLDTQEWAQLDHNIKQLMGAPIYIDDTPSLSVFELRSKARRLKTQHNVQCIIIDYLQLMNASGMNFGSREQEVSIISRNLKALAKELDIPIIALSQLNRSVETRGGTGVDGKRPQLSDLRESGAIEQDADMVCFIHRPEYYKIYDDGHGHNMRGMAQIIVAKHRNGATGDVNLRFQQTYAKFLNNNDIISMHSEGMGASLNTDTPAPTYTTVTSKMNTQSSVEDEATDAAPF